MAANGWVLGRVTQNVLVPVFAARHATPGQVLNATGQIALVAVITAIGVAFRRSFAGMTQFRLQARYRRLVTRQYLRLPPAWHAQHPPGELLSNANADVEATFQVFAPLPMALGVVVMLITATAAMLLADSVLGAIGLLVFPVLTVLNSWYNRTVGPLVARSQALRAEVSAVAHESFDAAIVVKTLGRAGAETDRFAVVAEELRVANVAAGIVRGLFDPLIEALPTIATLLVLAFGAYRVADGRATTGDVIQVAYLLAMVSFPIRAFGWVLGDLARTAVGWTRVQNVLQATGTVPYGTRTLTDEPARRGGRLIAENVSYAHRLKDGELAPALGEIEFEIPAGRTLALVGATGSGKSTLAGLAVRLNDPDTGRLLIDDVALSDLSHAALVSAIANVPQTAFVFDDTVRGNLTLGEDFTDEQVWSALRLAQAEAFVHALPEGVQTRVGERGTTLSGGQRQRLVLARALIRRPRLIVLDDATSAIDPRIEQAILTGLRQELDDVTVLIVAYRLGTIALADEVLFLAPDPDGVGRIVARGTHQELMESEADYRDLVLAYNREAAR
jgi:ABC-type multidrug transport system fused ATPase/permease subunit